MNDGNINGRLENGRWYLSIHVGRFIVNSSAQTIIAAIENAKEKCRYGIEHSSGDMREQWQSVWGALS